MKNYQVSVLRNGFYVFSFFVNNVLLREREVEAKSNFPVVEFLKNGKVVAEFYPNSYVSYEIKEIDI